MWFLSVVWLVTAAILIYKGFNRGVRSYFTDIPPGPPAPPRSWDEFERALEREDDGQEG